MLPDLLTRCAFIASDERREASRGAFIQHVSPPDGRTCPDHSSWTHAKAKSPKSIFKICILDQYLLWRTVKRRRQINYFAGEAARVAGMTEANRLPEPIIAQDGDTVRRLDESLSRHVSV